MRLGLTLALLPAVLGAQRVTVSAPADRESAVILRSAISRAHVVRMGAGRLDLPRDSVVSTSVIVIGRSATVASTVHGDVIVIGGDLYLHPGVAIDGQAVAIGGAVMNTTLGHVTGAVRSFRDETFDVAAQGGDVALTYRSLRATTDKIALLTPAGIQGLLIPSYNRVNGLSLPIGGVLTLPTVELQGSLTYRSRIGTVDPRIDVRAGSDSGFRFEGMAGRVTRSNDSWIYSDPVNSALSLFLGNDARNYFRSRDVEGRLFYHAVQTGRSIEPFVGARHERTSPITAAGNVFSVRGRHDLEKMARPNPLVESGDISSVLVGATLFDTSGVVTTRLSTELEQSFSSPSGTSTFTQITAHLRLGFPTFGLQRLELRGHGVATLADAAPRSRYAYLGGSGTLPVLDLLEMGGSQLFFLETRYLYPLERVVLPFVGSPIITFRHILGSAGVGGLPALEQEIGVGVGLSALHADVTTDVARHRGTKFGVGISLGH